MAAYTELDKALANPGDVTFLDLRDNKKIKNIPDEIRTLKSLESINISYTSVNSLPEALFELPEIRELRMAGTKLKTISRSISKLTHLTILDLDFTRTLKLDASLVCGLENLKTLCLRDIKIINFPDDFSTLKNLEFLDLGYTNINTLPETIFKTTIGIQRS